jgi:hypothetical protein
MPDPQEYANAGVFGKSDTGAGVSGVSTSGLGPGVSGVNLTSDPILSGPGVLGISDFNFGVSGISASGIGVVGTSTSSTGVSGVNLSSDPTKSGPGVEGFAAANRGGVFSSKTTAQLRLVPMAAGTIPIVSGRLQIAGLKGDLLATVELEDTGAVAHLWFCQKDGAAGVADWAQLI